MSTDLPFCPVHVLAERPLTGNPLAVVAQAQRLNEPLMKAIAREFNQSETTFLLPPTRPGATWRLRSFTPSAVKVFGAGHNALGAWWWLASDGRLELSRTVARFAQQLGNWVLPVEVLTDGNGRGQAVVMEQAPPSFGGTVRQLASLAVALGLTAEDLRSDISAQVVDTGAAHLLVAAIDRAAVDRAEPKAALLAAELGHEEEKCNKCRMRMTLGS